MAPTDDGLDQALDPELEGLTPTDPTSIPPDQGDRSDEPTFIAPPSLHGPQETSGMGVEHRIRARDRALQAATLALTNAATIHYTEDTPAQIAQQGGTPRRWDGIHLHRNARLGQFPTYADCSSFVTWCLWNGLHLGFSIHDIVNGENWAGGYTGSLLRHGMTVAGADQMQRGDCVLYGSPGSNGSHTAIFVGRRSDGTLMVISHGSENAPYYLPYNYRTDIMGYRRYI